MKKKKKTKTYDESISINTAFVIHKLVAILSSYGPYSTAYMQL
jgi:predicted GNAT superfamily acetyltransferase